MTSRLEIRLQISERATLARVDEPLRFGVPVPRGMVRDPAALRLEDRAGQACPLQVRTLASWTDGSAQWLLVDTLVSIGAGEQLVLWLKTGAAAPIATTLRVAEGEGSIEVDTQTAVFRIPRRGTAIVSSVQLAGREQLAATGLRIRLRDGGNREQQASVEIVRVEEQSALRSTVVLEGVFRGGDQSCPLEFLARLVFVAGSTVLDTEFRVRNPRRARHSGGLWDLGDPGSQLIRELTMELEPVAAPVNLSWRAERDGSVQKTDPAEGWVLYQDSSGGNNWNSPSHVDADGLPTVRFRGYRVCNAAGQVCACGDRAMPCVELAFGDAALACAVENFWQNFPKALRATDGRLQVSLFPPEAHAPVELQGGEQKRHRVWFSFGRPDEASGQIVRRQQSLVVALDPQYLESTHAMHGFVAPRAQDDPRYVAYMRTIIEGEHSFFAGREVIDEYDWRNFGEVYADHEAVNHKGPEPFVSHYNNQYDVLLGLLRQGLRGDDARWFELAHDLARHVMDIDIYHTQADRASYNGGLFWHSDHHLPAGSATHRTYSRTNATGSYGGGPDNEHNYTSGLLIYYFLTGDPEASEAVRTLANFVISMDDGGRTIFRFIDRSPTGNASKTVSFHYHGPGRGAGNSINALLDALQLTTERRYLAKAEELIQRCVHPDDDIRQLGLDDPESRWSYLVFLQALGKYLSAKCEREEFDYTFYYARDSLLRYAAWMLEHERPYSQMLHKVLLPTETWPAQDVRKAQVLAMAASYCPDDALARLLSGKAGEYADRCVTDLLAFPTAHFVRPRVLLAVYGPRPASAVSTHPSPHSARSHQISFAEPVKFVPQRERVMRRLRKISICAAALIVLSAVVGASVVYIGARYYSISPKMFVRQAIRVVSAPVLARIYAADQRRTGEITAQYWHGADFHIDGKQAVPFVYEAPDVPYLQSMRQRYELESLIAGAPSEYEAILRVAAWVGAQFDHGTDPVVGGDKACDPVGLIEAGRAGNKYWCEIAARVMVHAAASLAVPARVVTASRDGYTWEHAVSEVWSNEHGKWFVVDTDFNYVYERNGVPLSAVELMRHGRQWKSDGTMTIRRVAPAKPSIPSGDPLDLYRYVHVDMRNDWCSRVLRRGSPASGDLATWWVAQPGFGPLLAGSRKVVDPGTLNWPVNSVYIASPTGNATTGWTIKWAAYSPYFAHIERQTESGDWIAESEPVISQLPGRDTLRLRVVTLQGWKGPVYSFDLPSGAGE